MRRMISPSASSTVPSPLAPSPPSHEGWALHRLPTWASPGQSPCGAHARLGKARISRARDSWHPPCRSSCGQF
jgi:hypothetical protein